MQQRIKEFGGQGSAIVFAHANGYPVGSYQQFFAELTPHYKVTGYHHRPIWSDEPAPRKLDWDCFAADLVETLEATQSEPVWMMGHSMGAVIAAQAADRRPDLFRGLILIDPVFILRRFIAARAMMSDEKIDAMPMIRKTLGRPDRFQSPEQAFEFHRGKRAFAGFSDEVLWDYINAGTRLNKAGEYELAYAPAWEAAAYRSTPRVWGLLKRVQLPLLGLRGETSDTLSPKAFQRWARVQPQADLRECRGGHLLPFEYPAETASQVIDFLGQQEA